MSQDRIREIYEEKLGEMGGLQIGGAPKGYKCKPATEEAKLNKKTSELNHEYKLLEKKLERINQQQDKINSGVLKNPNAAQKRLNVRVDAFNAESRALEKKYQRVDAKKIELNAKAPGGKLAAKPKLSKKPKGSTLAAKPILKTKPKGSTLAAKPILKPVGSGGCDSGGCALWMETVKEIYYSPNNTMTYKEVLSSPETKALYAAIKAEAQELGQ